MRKGLPACRLAREGWLAPPLFLNVPHSTSVGLSHSHALAFSLILSLCSSFYLHFTLRLFFSSYRLRPSSSLSLHPSPFLDLSAFTFCSPRHAGRSFALVTTFPPTEPPTPRLYNDVNSHAHVFKPPHYSRDLRPDSWNRTRFLTSKATVAFSSRGARFPNFPCVLQQ